MDFEEDAAAGSVPAVGALAGGMGAEAGVPGGDWSSEAVK